jgi:Flp pilus assembly secretin CpaC
MRRSPLALSVAISLFATAAGAQMLPVSRAVTPLSVGAGQATRLALSAPVRDIVVGDPDVADVSIVNERTLVILGKKAGATTLMAFDARGQALADRQVMVSDIPDQAVIVQRGATASAYACGERCAPLTSPGPAPAAK